ncbi:MAG: hypothetical protein KAT05_00045, partial [Spirochaetes bacterium]|nr:hypothetical protein [Spirochaetota bacterium]
MYSSKTLGIYRRTYLALRVVFTSMNDDFTIVPDTSIIIDGRITAKLESGEYSGATIIISEALVSEL